MVDLEGVGEGGDLGYMPIGQDSECQMILQGPLVLDD